MEEVVRHKEDFSGHFRWSLGMSQHKGLLGSSVWFVGLKLGSFAINLEVESTGFLWSWLDAVMDLSGEGGVMDAEYLLNDQFPLSFETEGEWGKVIVDLEKIDGRMVRSVGTFRTLREQGIQVLSRDDLLFELIRPINDLLRQRNDLLHQRDDLRKWGRSIEEEVGCIDEETEWLKELWQEEVFASLFLKNKVEQCGFGDEH